MKWIEGKYTNDDFRYNDRSYKCSNCGCIMPYPENFCPDCGEKNNGTVDRTVFVVTYWDNELEPVVTVFNNQENAEKCCSFFKEKHDGCCIDEVPVYKHFGINEKAKANDELWR